MRSDVAFARRCAARCDERAPGRSAPREWRSSCTAATRSVRRAADGGTRRCCGAGCWPGILRCAGGDGRSPSTDCNTSAPAGRGMAPPSWPTWTGRWPRSTGSHRRPGRAAGPLDGRAHRGAASGAAQGDGRGRTGALAARRGSGRSTRRSAGRRRRGYPGRVGATDRRIRRAGRASRCRGRPVPIAGGGHMMLAPRPVAARTAAAPGRYAQLNRPHGRRRTDAGAPSRSQPVEPGQR